MDQDRPGQRNALRARAEAAMTAALAAAYARAPSLSEVIADSIEAIQFVCWDSTLDAGDRLALIDDARLLTSRLKELPRAARAAWPALIVEILRRTNELLRRYAEVVRSERTGS